MIKVDDDDLEWGGAGEEEGGRGARGDERGIGWGPGGRERRGLFGGGGGG